MKSMQVRQTRIYLFVLVVVIVLIIMMGILFFRQNKIKTQHRTVLLEQRLLRVQMNPHFMFNALAGLQVYIWKKDPKTANEYLASFSKLLRSILENSRQEFVPVEKEIETIKHYLKLQSYLHQDKFNYSVVVDEAIDMEYLQIPPMLTQPFIENSIEHGISARETKGNIEIRFTLEGDLIHVEVTDDGIGFRLSAERKKERSHESLAMKITMDRLSMLSKKYHRKFRFLAADILDDQRNIAGAKVSFDLPYTQL
jgi:sensor histidine kinase YesM